MSLLQSLAGGLRGAAGVLNPDVQRQTFAADEREAAAMRQAALQQQMMQQQHLLQQATPQAQMQRQQLENEIKFREAVAAAQGDEAKLFSAFMEYKPEAGMMLLKSKEERAARAQIAAERLEEMREKREQDFKLGMERITDQRQRDAFERQYKADRLQLDARIADSKDAYQRDSLALKAMVASMRPQRQERMVPVDQGDGTQIWTPESQLAGVRSPTKGGKGSGTGAGGGKLPAEVQRMTIGLNALEAGLTAYENMLKEFNPRSLDQLTPTQRAGAASLVADLRMQAKEAIALGALTGPDITILDQALADPTTMRGAFYGKDGLKEQINQTRAAIKRRRAGMDKQFPGQGLGTAKAPPKITNDAEYGALPSGEEFIAPDGTTRRKP